MIFRKNVMITKLASDVLNDEVVKCKHLNSYLKINKAKLIDYAVVKVFSPKVFEQLVMEKDYKEIFRIYGEIIKK